MRKTIAVIFQMKAAISGNTLLYYLKRLPVIKELFPDSMYADGKLKESISFLAMLLYQFAKLLGKGGYLFLFVLLPAVGVPKAENLASPNAVPLMVHILFCLSCISGSLQTSMIFNVTRQKFVCVKYMKMDPAEYVKSEFLMEYLPHFLYFLPFLLAMFLLAGGSAWQALLLWLLLICFRMMGEAFQLWLFDRTGVVFSRKIGLVWVMILMMLAAAYAPVFLKAPVPTATWLLSIPGVACALVLGGISLYYCLWGYRQYGQKLPRALDSNYLFSAEMAKSKQTGFRDVQLKEDDLRDTPKNRSYLKRLSGYAYLNALFFERHRRLLLRPVKIRLAIIGGVLASGLVAAAFFHEQAALAAEHLPQLLPVFVFIMYFLSVAEKACRAMFYNCDISLLRCGFYRSPKVILANFRIRLGRLLGYNLMIGGALAASLLAFQAACGQPIWNGETLLFTAALLLLSVFFTVHHLFLYYVLQPYTTELNVKNPLFQVVNSVVYFLCFFCMQIKTASSTFALGVLVLTLGYTVVALVLVYRLAPKNFRVK